MMVTQGKRWILWCFALMFAASSQAAVSDKSLNELLSASGVEQMVNEFPQTVKLGLVEAFKQQPDTSQKEVDDMIRAMDETIVPEQIIAEIKQSLSEKLSDAEVSSLLAWYRSPLGRAFTEAESNSSTEEAFAAMSQEAPALLKRKALMDQVGQIETLMDLTTLTVDFFENVQLAVFAGLMSVMEPQAPVGLEVMQKELDAVRKQSEANVEQMMKVSLAYAYKDFTPEEMDKYIAFLSTPEAKKFNLTATQSMFDSLEKSFHNWAKKMGAELDEV